MPSCGVRRFPAPGIAQRGPLRLSGAARRWEAPDSKTAIGERQGALTGSIFSDVPVVLIEMVTLSNPHDAGFIKEPRGQSLMAQAIANGIGRYVPASNSPRVR